MTTWNYQSTSENTFTLSIGDGYVLKINGSEFLLIEDDTPTTWTNPNQSSTTFTFTPITHIAEIWSARSLNQS